MSVFAQLERRRALARIEQRPGAIVYGLLVAVLVASVFPFYWSSSSAAATPERSATRACPGSPAGTSSTT